jgi:hypothetical protein
MPTNRTGRGGVVPASSLILFILDNPWNYLIIFINLLINILEKIHDYLHMSEAGIVIAA